jgi:predicted phage terminase large subunit-like protein
MDTNDHECHKTYYSAIDFAISQKAKRSYTVILTAGVDEQGYVHIVDVIRRRMDSKEIVDEILSTTNIYDPDLFIMEEGALRKAIGPFLQAEMLRTGIFPNIHPKVPENDKRSRARAIQGRMRQGGVKFDMDAEWYPSLEQEMLRFDRGEYDDQVDAISWIGLVLNEMREAPTREELDDMEYEEDVMQDESYMYEGQNSTTGY